MQKALGRKVKSTPAEEESRQILRKGQHSPFFFSHPPRENENEMKMKRERERA
jgi:hypothetical protein